ncbi:hypothetical protein N1030_01645 [Desulfovibrio mangrovi]|uniref:hypothetical protein n=1 Tax=Desulfovibrio mangrovi TaxID=2976983 RepID=UPI002248743D|nr:hypothetical protein [Desulfovibrio mangrovi]UZP67698.1 hypothetical protein N1030_01645 [Desulfovibrio mangrovi]
MKYSSRINYVLLLTTLLLTACATLEPIPPTYQSADFPKIGDVQTIEVGEPMCDQGTLAVYHGIEIVEIPAGHATQLAVGDVFIERYMGRYVLCRQGVMPPHMQEIIFDKSGLFGALEKIGAKTVTKDLVLQSSNYLRQQLLYNGRSKDSVYFSYREFASDMARPSYSQDLTFDISSDQVVGIKGARFEIIKASNTEVTYKMLKPFK